MQAIAPVRQPFADELAQFQQLLQAAPQGEVTALQAHSGTVRHFVVYVDRTGPVEQLTIQYNSGGFEVVIEPGTLTERLVSHLGYFLQGRCRRAAFAVVTDVERVCAA